MTDVKKRCDVCDNTDEYYAGVASSALGPMSCAWCQICLAMRAEMRVMVESVIEGCGGIDSVSDKVGLVYYDKGIDSYVDYRTKMIIPIKLKNGGNEFKKRSAFVEWDRENR